jgi:cytochrome c-type biogenesis protein CcmH
MRRLVALVAVLLALMAPMAALAVNPSEMLKDPALEARARAISSELRCLVCQNESIDDSNAKLAHDLRVLVRQRLVAGDTNAQVKQYIVDRYGEFVLLRPVFAIHTLVLWFAAPAVLLIGAIAIIFGARRKGAGPQSVTMTDEDRGALAALRSEEPPT